jgi:predicted ATPase
MPELRSRFRGLPRSDAAAAADATLLFEAVAQLLLSISEEKPIAVLVDDLQWCDASSCNVLHFLVRRLEAPILWCSTFTLGGVERDAPAARLVRALRAHANARSMILSPLTEEEVWQLIRELGRIDGPTGARRLAARIHEVTAGNPFYVVELLKTLFARDVLAVDAASSGWVVRAPLASAAAASLTTTVHEAIAERIECLRDELYALLITIAVAAHGCRTDTLSHVHGVSRLRAAMLGDALVERHLVTESDGVYACAHPIIARVVRDGLSISRRREVHRALALALEVVSQQDGHPSVPGDIARHAEQAGERSLAYRNALRASESSSERLAYEEALSWLDLAAGMATTGDESEVVNKATARVLGQAGWVEVPPLRPVGSFVPTPMQPEDLDLPTGANH